MNKVLFIVEGVKTEIGYAKSVIELQKELLSKNGNKSDTIVIESYGTLIYDLYKKINDLPNKDEFETIPLLREILEKKNKDKDYSHLDDIDSFSEIFLFFDLDAHYYKKWEKEVAITTVIEQIGEMLNLFNESTEKGQLMISYPMVESIKCYSNEFVDFDKKRATISFYPIFPDVHFKDASKLFCKRFPDYNKRPYNIDEMISLIKYFTLCSKYLTGSFYLETITDSLEIFNNQHKKFIFDEKKVVLLSAFPQFILYTFGNKFYDGLSDIKENILGDGWEFSFYDFDQTS